MRKIIVLMFVSLDGVIQAPGGPDEDTSGGFKYGGWTVPYFDEYAGKIMSEQMSKPADLLLGRKTFEIFASYWPQHENEWPGVNDMTKYVVSKTIRTHSWKHTVFLKNAEDVNILKKQQGPDLHVYGSSLLLQSLLKLDLIDEFWLKIFPVTIGQGKRLFGEGTIPAKFKLIECKTSPSGVLIASYTRNGALQTGSFG